jgi:hypothetical protein
MNNKDNNGDTALHMVMIRQDYDAATLLLQNGAEVMGSGFEDTTVLMKPFLEEEVIEDLESEMIISEEEADEWSNRCIKLVLSHWLSMEAHKMYVDNKLRDQSAEDEVKEDHRHWAKRQKR